jgi:hypothetical protein
MVGVPPNRSGLRVIGGFAVRLRGADCRRLTGFATIVLIARIGMLLSELPQEMGGNASSVIALTPAASALVSDVSLWRA